MIGNLCRIILLMFLVISILSDFISIFALFIHYVSRFALGPSSTRLIGVIGYLGVVSAIYGFVREISSLGSF